MVLDHPPFNAALTQATTSFQDGTGKAKDRVVINVGGKRHETYISTIRNFPDTRLYWIAETAAKMVDFDPERNEFFFDRHPGCFENILNYCRTGKLHCPNDVCGPLFEEELAFWGIDELQMEPCCWGTYTQHRNAHKHLRMFDKIRTEGAEGDDEEITDETNNKVGVVRKSRLREFLARYRPIVWSTLELPYSSKYAQGMALANLLVIVLSIASFCIETMDFAKKHRFAFTMLEYFYCAFFTIDFVIRLCCCPHIGKFFQSPMTWIDLVSIVQFYINFFTKSDALNFLFVLRLVRIFRLFRFFKNLSGMQVIGQTLKASARELFLLVLILLIPMVIFSTLVYFAEKQQQSGTFRSIPETFWWAIITMTTVGYGDVTPKSSAGKVVGALCACSGVLILALPVSVIGSNFTLYYSYAQARLRLPKRKQPALVMADKALVNAKIEQRDTDHGSEYSEDEKKTPRSRRQAISMTASSMNSTPKLGKKSGMVSSGLSGLAHVMVEMTVPGQRRMALTPSSPITSQLNTRKTMCKSISTISSDTEGTTSSDTKQHESSKMMKKIGSFFEGRRSQTTPNNTDECHGIESGVNLRTLDDGCCIDDAMRKTLTPHTAIVTPQFLQLQTDEQHTLENNEFDMADELSQTPRLNNSLESLNGGMAIFGSNDSKSPKKTPKKTKKKKKGKSKERGCDNLSLSDRNIPLRMKNGSASSPLLARLTRIGKSRSSKNLPRTDSTDSENLLNVHSGGAGDFRGNHLSPGAENTFPRGRVKPRGNSCIDIFVTDTDTRFDCTAGPSNFSNNNKQIRNGRNSTIDRAARSISLIDNPFTDISQ